MKKLLQKVICSALFLAMVLPIAACGKKDENWTTISTSQEDQTIVNTDVTKITFAVPDFCNVDSNHLKLFNEELQKDGHKYQLEMKKLDSENYAASLENELKNGNIDVAFLGLGDGSNNIIQLLNSGLFLNLDEILSSEKGKVLYNSFPKALWESVKCNGHFYSIPNTNADDHSVYAAFNKDYIGEEAIENWDGSIEGIYKIIKNVKWNDEEAPRFQYLVPDFDFAKMIRCEFRNGLLYDYDTMQIENPLESEKFINYFKVLEQMKSDGYLADSVSYYQNASYADENAHLTSGKFLVVLAKGEPKEYLLRNNICIKPTTPFLSSRINASIGISKDTGNTDSVVDFLGILYSEEKYANILIYGKQDEDYKLVDGFPVNMDGSEVYDNYIAKICLNLFINVHPVKDDIFSKNRKETYFSFYDDIKLSPFIGFNADNASAGDISNDLELFMEKLSKKSLDEAVSEYSTKFKSDGIDAYIDSVKKQWESFHQ